MSSENNETPKPINNKENNQQIDNILVRTDSPNVNDNETNKILDKEEHINEATNLKHEVNIQKEKENNDFYHDKDITEDSIIYFSKKLKAYNENYKFILYISVILYSIDVLIWFKADKNLHNFYNGCSLLLILIASIHQAFIFRHNFENISKELYNFTKKIIYVFVAVFLIYALNIIYIFLMKVTERLRMKYVYSDTISEKIFILFYCFINIFVPSLHLFRLISVKKGIKDLSSARGEIYESSKIEDVEVIQSVINEI